MTNMTEIFRRFYLREPDKQNLELFDKLAVDLPPDMREDIGIKTEIVIRANHIRELQHVVNEAGNVARRKAEMSGEEWAIKAADRVWRHVVAQLPPSASVAIFRTLVMIVICCAMSFAGGWILCEERYETASESLQALTETEFAFCVSDAAQHASQIRSGKVPGDTAQALRDSTRNCAAEYDQRRAAL